MATQPVHTELRKTGIGVVGDVPWGTHFFMFYETKQDLLDTLVPYFKAGFQPGLEVRHECIEQVLLGLVKHEEVSAPRHIADHTNSGLAQFRMNGLCRHRNHLSYAASLRSIGKMIWNTAPRESDTSDNCPL